MMFVFSQRRVGVVWMFLFYPGLDRRRFGDVCAARVSDSYHIMLPAAMMGVTFWSVVVLGLMMPVCKFTCMMGVLGVGVGAGEHFYSVSFDTF